MTSKRQKRLVNASAQTTADGKKSTANRRAAPEQGIVAASAPKKSDLPPHRPKLVVEVVWGDITRARADVFAVGHYMGLPPQKAELALDRVVSGQAEGSPRKLLITELTRRG